MSEQPHQPIPSDEISSIAGKVLGLPNPNADVIKAGVPMSAESYAELLADAKKLAGFVLNSDPKAGANHG